VAGPSSVGGCCQRGWWCTWCWPRRCPHSTYLEVLWHLTEGCATWVGGDRGVCRRSRRCCTQQAAGLPGDVQSWLPPRRGVSPRAPGEIAGVVTSQAPGLAGALSRGQRSTAIAKASCAASSARSKSPRKPINAASTRPHRSRKTCPRVVTNTVRPGAPRLRPQDGPPGSARPARSSHRGRRPPRRSSRRSPP
jgi:hypothetical protein